jgi:PIN domain nuclease of toxin-antitoxin system
MRNVHIWYINQDFHLISHTKKLNKLVISGTFTSLYVNITRTWEATNKSRFNRLKKTTFIELSQRNDSLSLGLSQGKDPTLLGSA